MPGATWDDLEGTDFKPFEPSHQVIEALKTIRKAQKCLTTDETTSDEFFEETGMVLAEALWSEAKIVVLRCCGPEVPTHVTTAKGTTIPLSIATLQAALAGMYPNKQDLENTTMLLVLAQCLVERISVIRSQLITAPKDWWIRLILSDLYASVVTLHHPNWAE